MRRFFTLLLFCSVISCNPYINTNLKKDRLRHEPYNGHAFALIEKDTVQLNDTSLVGIVEILDEGFTINCDYVSIVSMLIERAKDIGGNCLVIKEHKEPDWASNCHRIKGNVYHIENPRKYEHYVYWTGDRELERLDYKGNKLGETESSFLIVCYLKSYKSNYESFIIGLESIFLSNESYLEESGRDSFNLINENLYFDITELYRRELYRKIREELSSYNELYGRIEQVHHKLMKECEATQKQCRIEIVKDNKRQKYWVDWIEKELFKLAAYDEKTIELPLNPIGRRYLLEDEDR